LFVVCGCANKLNYSTGALVRTEKTFSEVDTSCNAAF